MHNDFALLLNLAASLVLALIFGLITEKLRLSPIVGYLLAGFMLGPQTPGMVADPKMAAELAEIGVVLLMFGVGLHFNLRELLSVRRIAIPGACGQILVATLLGAWLMIASGLGWRSGMVVGIAISVASTVVLIRMLMDNDIIHSPQGHIAVGWLIVEDIFTVLVLVALPAFAPAELVPDGEAVSLWYSLLLAVVKVSALALVVVGGGRFVIPWLLGLVASTRSRELFTLSILAIALAVATGSAFIFGVSMALGAFLAGMVVGQTEVSHQAAADALPMRDAFAVLFFVSVGMLFDPFVMIEHPVLFLGLLSIILIIKAIDRILNRLVLAILRSYGDYGCDCPRADRRILISACRRGEPARTPQSRRAYSACGMRAVVDHDQSSFVPMYCPLGGLASKASPIVAGLAEAFRREGFGSQSIRPISS